MKNLMTRISIIFANNNLANVNDIQSEFHRKFGVFLQENSLAPTNKTYIFNNGGKLINLSNSHFIVQGNDFEDIKNDAIWFIDNLSFKLGINIHYAGITGEFILGELTDEMKNSYPFLNRSSNVDTMNLGFCIVNDVFYNNVSINVSNNIASDVNLRSVPRKPSFFEIKGKEVRISVDLNDKYGFLTEKTYLFNRESFNKLIVFYNDFISQKLYDFLKTI